MDIEEKFSKKLEELEFNKGVLNMTCNKFKFLEKIGYTVEVVSNYIQISRYDGTYDNFSIEFYPYHYRRGDVGLKRKIYRASECDQDITLNQLLDIISIDYYSKLEKQKGE